MKILTLLIGLALVAHSEPSPPGGKPTPRELWDEDCQFSPFASQKSLRDSLDETGTLVEANRTRDTHNGGVVAEELRIANLSTTEVLSALGASTTAATSKPNIQADHIRSQVRRNGEGPPGAKHRFTLTDNTTIEMTMGQYKALDSRIQGWALLND
ncbi:MAG: hypothetical protein HYZ71_00960 [Deltaproteobacteria bacterium]|nr:hypothetical protein [Deltaproteobacteria bacterium]